mmetsp:Transcript_23696/g.57528  ORF Transcript_23696/g.57528 Transcript_23696/m.57528 type:complete len:163 (-) Transcript_23696:75-563(-)
MVMMGKPNRSHGRHRQRTNDSGHSPVPPTPPSSQAISLPPSWKRIPRQRPKTLQEAQRDVYAVAQKLSSSSPTNRVEYAPPAHSARKSVVASMRADSPMQQPASRSRPGTSRLDQLIERGMAELPEHDGHVLPSVVGEQLTARGLAVKSMFGKPRARSSRGR